MNMRSRRLLLPGPPPGGRVSAKVSVVELRLLHHHPLRGGGGRDERPTGVVEGVAAVAVVAGAVVTAIAVAGMGVERVGGGEVGEGPVG